MNHRNEAEEGTVFLEPEYFDQAIVGKTLVNGKEILAYDYFLLIDALAKEEKLDWDDALEWIEYNTLRSIPYMGEGAPVVVNSLAEDGEQE